MCMEYSVLQILFQVNTVVQFDIWINHLLLVDKIQCTNSLPLLAFYKFLYLCKLSTISEGELADLVHLLKVLTLFLTIKLREMTLSLYFYFWIYSVTFVIYRLKKIKYLVFQNL